MDNDLLFLFKEMDEELGAFIEIASPFLEPDAAGVITRFREELRGLETAEQNRRRPWEIKLDLPVVTKASKSYVGTGGKHFVWASFSALWEVMPMGERNKKKRNRRFSIGGKASTRVEIWCGERYGDPDRLAMWRMEIGGVGHPGSIFHVQVLGDAAVPPFPTWLDIPRFPGFIATPAQVMEFALAELFQDEWIRRLADAPQGLATWSRIQRPRFERLFEWQVEELRNGSGSPWADLKSAKPVAGMLV